MCPIIKQGCHIFRYNGSSLQVMVCMSVDAGEWAILGGTGKFMLAQGVIHKANISGVTKIDIEAVYNEIVVGE